MIRTWAQRTLPPILAALLWPAFTARVEGGPFTDAIAELQPVVVTGGEVPDLLGLPVDEIWAYRYDAASASFIQIAVQVDERAPLDLTLGQGAPIYELTYDWFGDEDGLLVRVLTVFDGGAVTLIDGLATWGSAPDPGVF